MSYPEPRYLGETGEASREGRPAKDEVEVFYRKHDNVWLEVGSDHAGGTTGKGSAR